MILSYMRTIILYLVLIFCIRMMGKRHIGQMEPSEFVVTMMVANLAVIPMLTILGTELVLSGATMRSIRLRKLLCGKPVILIENGKILQENLRSTRVTLDELTGHLREKDVLDIRSVQYAILETNGNLSVFPFPSELPASAKEAGIYPKDRFLPITVISDGELLEENLAKAKKDLAWVHRVLEERHAGIKDTWLLTVDGGNHITFFRKEEG